MEYSMGAVLVVRYKGMEIYFELVLLIHILIWIMALNMLSLKSELRFY